MAGVVTLTTDFGTQDGYVGAMKGVILALAPTARIVDVSHDVPAFDVAAGAFAIATAARWFPPGTVHVGVVDPGVGSARAAVAIAAGDQLFVGPDNGLFALAAPVVDAAVRLEPPADAAATFHGRDVFAPAAARLARGEPLAALGPAHALSARASPRGVVIHVDRFGNLVTDLGAGARVEIAGVMLDVRRTYADVEPGELVAYLGSAGTIEIAVREGSAARRLGLGRGAPVRIA